VVNHVRSCLLNYPGGLGVSTVPYAEWIPPEYAPVPLPPDLATIHAVIFGHQPDEKALHYTARLLMPILHATELEALVLALDPRVTYLPFIPEPDGMQAPPNTVVLPPGGLRPSFLGFFPGSSFAPNYFAPTYFTPGRFTRPLVLPATPTQDSPAEIYQAVQQLGPALRAVLFGVDDPEPYQSLRNIWDDTVPMPLKLGAVLLGLAYRIDALRGGQHA